jgi:iron complex outermembrane recepter protein
MRTTNNMRRNSIRWQLLATVSAAALLATGTGNAQAADSDRPLVWIELGGQMESLNSPQEDFSPPFMSSITQANLLSALNVQQPPKYAFGEEGRISYQPAGSDWIFSASLRYGRSNKNEHHHQQTQNAKVPKYFTFYGYKFGPTSKYPDGHQRLADGVASQSERHLIVDFQAGKDVGLGLFGGNSMSTVSAGIRMAQFTSKSKVALHAEPDLQYPTAPITSLGGMIAFLYAPIHFHDYAATADIMRGFHGIGPSLAWNASVPIAGNTSSAELTLDWGANAALLFGRQTARGHHQSTVKSYNFSRWQTAGGHAHGYKIIGNFEHQSDGSVGPSKQYTYPMAINRSHSVTVPNFGGFAGVSLRYADAKVSLGYRADFFFGAIDGGIDTRKNENRGFFGPFASISIGLGD